MDEKARCLVSVHFPKSGGTSLKIAFTAALTAGEFLEDYGDDPVNPDRLSWTAPNLYEKRKPVGTVQFRCVHGHFSPSKYDAVDAVRIVMLRNPVDTIISIFYYWLQLAHSDYQGHQLFRTFKEERPKLLDFVKYPTLRFLMSQTYFGGYDMSRFSAIGNFSDRERYYAWIEKTMGLTLDRSIHENVTLSSEERDELSRAPDVRAKLNELLSDDVAFYKQWAGIYEACIY